jgi:hypothetical protein
MSAYTSMFHPCCTQSADVNANRRLAETRLKHLDVLSILEPEFFISIMDSYKQFAGYAMRKLVAENALILKRPTTKLNIAKCRTHIV